MGIRPYCYKVPYKFNNRLTIMATLRKLNILPPGRFLKLIKGSLAFLFSSICYFSGSAQAVPTLNIPQVPLIMASPIHPQVLILIGNSQSMDGTLSGAIMTGSGSLATGLSSLNNSSSPTSYTVPTGFTPPIQAADGLGKAPYTVLQSGKLYDNGPSRLNMAKAGIDAIIDAYMPSTDFALAAYNTSGTQVYNTMVYYMSVAGSDFTFTNTPIAGNRYVNNPCYKYSLASATVLSNCTSMATFYGSATLENNQYMQIGASSDDPSINDVLYIGSGFPGTFLTYTGPTPATPYPPNFSLANYNAGSILVSYSRSYPNIGSFGTSPTNAGYVPFSPQVIYSQRGFGYYGSQSATSGTILVPMTTAGTVPTTASVTTAINAFAPFLAPETNSSSSTEIKAIAVQSPTAGLLTQANTYLNPLATTSGNGCPQKKYVILISDGLPTQDLAGKFWPPLGSAAAAGYGVTATFNVNGSLNTTNDQALTDAIAKIKVLKDNGILTYIIGMGAGVDPTLNPQAAASLTAMAVAGGTGNYYPATSPTALVSSLNTILVAIQNGEFSVSAAAVSSTHLNGDTVEYQASFISNDIPYQDWTGNLEAIKLDPTTGAPTTTVLWSAQGLLDSLVSGSGWLNNRVLATWNPVSSTGVPFQWGSLSPTQQSQLQPLDLLGANRLQYLRGNTALEKRNGGVFRNRSHVLGDLVDSQVTYVGVPNKVYSNSSYISFAKTYVDRTPLLYVGGNDGMLHAFNADTGVEAFGFIPNAVFNNLINLTSIVYNQSHQYFVNGSPQSSDVQFSNGTWHTVLAGGENGGGNSIYALDITNPASISTESALSSAVLWEFNDGDMGLSYSQPQIAPIGLPNADVTNFAVFFGNGYNSPTNKSVFYALNPQTGAIIRKIDLCAAVPGSCDATLPQGLSSVATGHKDGLQDHPITNVYAGDLQGNLWSIDVSNADPAAWTVRLLFQARTSGGAIQPITTAPVVSLHPNYPRKQGLFIMFGTGRLLIASDLLDTQTQTIYGVWDTLLNSSTYTRTNLQAQTLSLIAPATSGFTTSIITTTNNTLNWNSKVGWYSDLPVSGQRVVTTPDLINGAFVATINTPPLSVCGVGFSSMLLELNYATGGAITTGLLDLNGDGLLNASDQYNGNYAAGISLSQSYATAPNILGPNKNNKMVILITQSNGTQSTVLNPNTAPRKVGWWEIQ
jgi:type IV pilus assembly protein PilY1